jgi:multidrug resistance efflux pump
VSAPSTAAKTLPVPTVVAPVPVVQPRRPGLLARLARAVVYLGLAAVALGGSWLLVTNYLDARRLYVMTDNAQVDGRLIPIAASASGLVRAVNVDVGDEIRNGAVVARIDLGGVRTDPFSNKPRIDYDGLQIFDVTAPVDGVVVRRTVNPGSVIGTDAPLVQIVDASQLWIIANIEETLIRRVRPGQVADVYVDSLDITLPGRVEAIVQASSASFSPIPQQNLTGNYTRVVQLQPVKIVLVQTDPRLAIGTSASVKIHVAD